MNEMKSFWETVGLVAAVSLPLWNIPLIYRIVRRKSSTDISLAWVVGVWSCILLMFPSAFQSNDFTFRVFSVINLTMFTGVLVTVLFYRKGPKG